MRKCDSKTTDLQKQLSKALRSDRFAEALDYYELIEARKPNEPRWAHRKGDLLRKMGRVPAAVKSYERAVRLYSARGFDSRAAAMAKLLLAIDPSRADVLAWVDSEAARRSERYSRSLIPLAR